MMRSARPLTLDWQINNDLKFKSITAWRQINWNIGTDLDGEPESMQEVTDSQHQHQISQEFQLNGKAINDRLNYALGLYYFTEGGYVHDFVPFDTGYLYVLDEANDVKTDSYAAFAHLDFNVTDQWTLTAGGRYSEERKQFLGGQADLDGFSYKISGCADPSAVWSSQPGFVASLGANPAHRRDSPASRSWDSRWPAILCATSRTSGITRTGMCSRPPWARSSNSPRT